MYFSLSRLSMLDVKWANLFDTSNRTFSDQHYNPNYELIVIADGTVYLEADKAKMTLQCGESLLLKPWEQHTGWNAKEPQGNFFWVQFSCDPGLDEFLLDRASELNIVHAERTELRTAQTRHEDLIIIPRQYQARQRYKLLALFQELVETMNQPRGYFRFRASLLLAQMLQLLANDFLEQHHLDTASPASYFTFRRLVDYLNNFYESEISRDNLEREMDRKYEYLCQVFKKYAGTNIQHYLHELRTQRAKHLLHNTRKSVKEIAEEIGYQDPYYFSRMFKKIEGISPQHFRETGPVRPLKT
ncbi:helix-turn-helix domain-containing protein [Paenibacillus tarimensis]